MLTLKSLTAANKNNDMARATSNTASNLALAISNNLASLSLEMENTDSVQAMLEWMEYLMVYDSTEFYADFFSDNFVATVAAPTRPAAAA